MNDLTLLRLFVQVSDQGSFSAVARTTHTTPSAVSRQIARLEADLGTRLLQRTTRQQVLTEAGRVYLRHARQIIEDVETARREVSRLSNAPSGVLRVTAEADLALTLLTPILPEFLESYPDLRIQLHTSADMEDLIGRGIDVAIRVGHLDESSLVAKRLVMSRSLLVASPDFLKRNGSPQHPEDLSGMSCLSFRVETDLVTWRFKSGDEVASVTVAVRTQASSLVFLKEAVKSGLGIAMLPIWIVRNDLDSGELVPVLSGFPLEPSATPISAVYPSGRNLASKVRVFIDFLSAKMVSSSDMR
ncbi:LysR family transcriptional regulator [Roseibium aggregatum]|uniref:LysR family transcriptional regulator n=1 Tax=Roseibium aggregatum TaxID=187304 RepID=UPI0025ABA9D8|nr:LysR family transcriptional regulator [Roseibium aggregatum]WJS05683.1 LysR family transcriptional regulator [Roseibium aggregatum]